MALAIRGSSVLEKTARDFYCRTIACLNDSGIPYLIGGAYALQRYTGVERHTKDLDVFVRREDYDDLMCTLTGMGCHTELVFPHWLGKAHSGGDFVDVIFSSGNAIAEVDDEWFANAVPGEVFCMPVLLSPPEEMIWSKAFIMERERFDGADIAHLVLACGERLDWERLLRRFGERWRVLLSHLVMFGFVYPSERRQVPYWVMAELLGRMRDEMSSEPPLARVCNGTLISRAQYLIDVDRWGFQDARLAPCGQMSPADIAHWTAAIEN